MMDSFRIMLGTVITLLLVAGVGARIFDADFEEKLDDFVQSTMECRRVPGLTLSVIKDNETWTKGYGYTDMSTKTPVTKHTLFNIGSVTKSFTMVLLGKLLTDKNMTWTTKVRDIAGVEYKFMDEYRSTQSTLKDLLSHRTGLARLDVGLLAGFPHTTTREQMTKNMKYLPEEKPFRDSFIYNNYMFMYLGHLCELLGNDTWEHLLQKHVFGPLGMTSSKILKTPDDVHTANVAKPYIYKDGEYQPGTRDLYSLTPLEPAGAVLSSAEDMTQYMRFLMNKGKTDDGRKLVDEDLMTAAFKTTTVIASDGFLRAELLTLPEWPVGVTPRGYGHALFEATYRGYRKIYHSGGLFSYITRMFTFPDTQTGVFVSTNGPGFRDYASLASKAVANFASDGALGLEPWLNTSTTCTYPKPWLTEEENDTKNDSSQSTPLSNPSEYIGTYKHEFLPSMKVMSPGPDNMTLDWTMNRVSGVLHTTDTRDEFQMEILKPWEVMTSLTDRNNSTVKYHVTFGRQLDVISTLTIQYEVNVTYTRDVQ